MKKKQKQKRTDEIPFEYSADDGTTASNIPKKLYTIVSYDNSTEIDHSTKLNPEKITYDYSTEIDQTKNLYPKKHSFL